LEQFRSTYQEFQSRNVEIVTLGPDGARAFKKYWEENQLPFFGCPDIKSRVADTYYQEVNLLKFGRMPAEIIIDPVGILRFMHYGSSMSDIPEPLKLLQMIEKMK